MGCDLGGPSELRPTPVRCRNPPSCLQRGPNCTCDAAPFAISAQQTGWLPPFKGRLSPGITADAAGILGRQRPAPGPPKPAGAFKGSEAFISCRRRARPPLPASPRAPGQELPATGMGRRTKGNQSWDAVDPPISPLTPTPRAGGGGGLRLKVTEVPRPRAFLPLGMKIGSQRQGDPILLRGVLFRPQSPRHTAEPGRPPSQTLRAMHSGRHPGTHSLSPSTLSTRAPPRGAPLPGSPRPLTPKEEVPTSCLSGAPRHPAPHAIS